MFCSLQQCLCADHVILAKGNYKRRSLDQLLFIPDALALCIGQFPGEKRGDLCDNSMGLIMLSDAAVAGIDTSLVRSNVGSTALSMHSMVVSRILVH